MRLGLVLGAGVAGVVAAAGVAVGQFPGERPAVPFGGGVPQPTPAPQRPAPRADLPPGFQPAAPQPAPPVVRANYPTQPADDSPHPWAIKPENGAHMIMVKGYVGPDSRKLAEALCRHIRDTHRTPAYVYERNAAERKRERELQEAIRKKAEEDAQPFLRTIEQERKRAEQQGMPFVNTAPRIKVPKPVNPIPEQWAVLVGGFPTPEAARRGLTEVKKWAPPVDTTLMEQAVIVGPTEKGQPGRAEGTYLNPFANAMVVPNPTAAAAAADDKSRLEPFVVALNKDVPHTLLAARKPWTLIVKSFSTPLRLENKDGGGGTVFDKPGGMFGKKPNYLDLTAAQAMQLCETLRHKDMKPAPLESFVLHHRTGSIVTVGQFDAPDDPELLKTLQVLRGMTFQVTDDKTRMTATERMFDAVAPFPVPRR